MKRFVGILIAAALAVGAFAQGTFTIRRPVDDSTVRETVVVRIPKNSIPEGGYIGIIVNGKFLEAVYPTVSGGDYIYKLDTKGRKIADGDMTIEAVLYVDFNEKPQIVNRSSVKVKLDNHTSIRIPSSGMLLRYKFAPGTETLYRASQKQTLSTVTQAQRQLGSRGVETPIDAESFRFLYAIDNSYKVAGAKQGLLRIQAVPDKGKDYAILTTTGSAAAERFYDYEMTPLYMRITDTGREVFSSAPPYFGFEGAGRFSSLDLFLLNPLPILPSKRVKPGDIWAGGFQLGKLDLDKKDETQQFTHRLAARGSFEGVEWHKGIPCAKIRYAVEAGPKDLANVKNLNQLEGTSVKVEVEELVWFALDRGQVVRVEDHFVQEALIEQAVQQSYGVGFTGPSGTRSGAPGRPMAPGGGGKSDPGDMMVPDFRYYDFQLAPHFDGDGQLWLFQAAPGRRRGQTGQGGYGGPGVPGGPGGPMGPGGMMPGMGQPGMPGGMMPGMGMPPGAGGRMPGGYGRGTGATTEKVYLRIERQDVIELDR